MLYKEHPYTTRHLLRRVLMELHQFPVYIPGPVSPPLKFIYISLWIIGLDDKPLLSSFTFNLFHFSCFSRNSTFELSSEYSGIHTLDILVENMGRVNYGKPHDFTMKKGLSEGPVLLGSEELKDWLIYPLEFKSGEIDR